MSPPVRCSMPAKFEAGTTVAFVLNLASFPASQGWALEATLNGWGKVDATYAVEGTDGHRLTFVAADSAGLEAGLYRFAAYAVKGAERYLVDGQPARVNITPNVADAAAGTLVEACEQALKMVNASLATGASQDVMAYQVHGRSLQRYTHEERLSLRRELMRELRALRAQASGTFSREVRAENRGRITPW